VLGAHNPVHRRNHKPENVTGHPREEPKHQVKTAMEEAYRLDAKEGMAKLKQQAHWLQSD
jgi:hypothetical protein